MAPGWLGGGRVSTMEPAQLLLAARAREGEIHRPAMAWGLQLHTARWLGPPLQPCIMNGNAAICGGQTSHHWGEMVCSGTGDGE